MNYLDITKVRNYRGENFHIVPQGGRVYFYNLSDDGGSYNDVDYINMLSKKLNDIDVFNGNILVGGLGIGCIPNWLSHVCPFAHIDVIESNSELVAQIKSMEYLHKKINIINTDVFTFIPSIKYDAIIIDIWWSEDENTVSEISTLRNHYNEYIKKGGKLYTPIFEPHSYEKL